MATQGADVTSEMAPMATDENTNPEGKRRKTHRLKQRFQVVRKLGQGTYGKVQLAINNETGQEVAIKTIKKSKVESEQDLIRIRREIQIMSSIHHPHIIHIYEVFENKDKIVLVMQYASGGELYDYVSYNKKLSDSEARRLFRQIATAIYYCHKNQICHRDLKLENILLDEKGNAKIADFGLSNVFDEKHFLQTFCGSPLYASPEIVRGLPYFGPEVDCWSLGVLLYTLVYGAMPFDGSNFKKLVKQISESSYFEPAERSDATEMIQKLLKPNPRERATIIDICADEWVNRDYEHSLLQVAEDLSNLTPVRCDMLQALAPVSPTVNNQSVESTEENEKTKQEEQIKPPEESTAIPVADESNKRPIDNTSFSASTTEMPEKKMSKKKNEENVKENKSNMNESIGSIQDKPKEEVELTTEETPTQSGPSSGKPIQESNETKNESNEVSNENVAQTINNQSEQTQVTQSTEPAAVQSLPKEERSIEGSQENLNKSNISVISIGSPKRPGRLSIPKIWDTDNQEKTSSPEDVFKFDKKVPFIPVGLKVSEAKKVLERRCSVDSNRATLLSKKQNSRTNIDTKVRDMKKYTARSMSLNLNEIKSGQSINATATLKGTKPTLIVANEPTKEAVEGEVVSTDQKKNETDSVGPQTETYADTVQSPPSSKPSTPITEEDKSLAKQIIKKNIARAKLMEKQQISINSIESDTTPLVTIENSDISIIQNTPKVGDNSLKQEDGKIANKSCITTEPFSAAPITRSYKKVTFTKDGACITESGKFYTHEGKDGLMTRVEKKSMVTHIVTDNPSAVNLQRSDSQSSSGSTDIFDDIFDDHWTGDVFSNVKSLFNNILENSSRRFHEKCNLRSRAESLERNSNDSFSKRINRKSFFEDQPTLGKSLFDSQRSLFPTKSIFSGSYKSSFDRGFPRMEELIGQKQDSFKSSNFPLPRFGSRFSRETSLNREFESFENQFGREEKLEPNKQESTRKRIEQWLGDEDVDLNKRLETYGTIGPSNFRRYVRTVASNDSASNVFKRVQVSSSGVIGSEQSTATVTNVHTVQANAVPRNNEIEVKFTLDNLEAGLTPVVSKKSEVKVNNEQTFEQETTDEQSIDSGIKVAEQSSLLEQLRTLGYKNLMDRRLSESSSTEDLTSISASASASTSEWKELNPRSSGGSLGRNDVFGTKQEQTEQNESVVNLRRQHSNERASSLAADRHKITSTVNDSESATLTTANATDTHFDTQEVDFKSETVLERIHRKSYYSRFNEDSRNLFSNRQRRRSMTRLNEHSSELLGSSSSRVPKSFDTQPVTLSSFFSFDPDRITTSSSSSISKLLADSLGEDTTARSSSVSNPGSTFTSSKRGTTRYLNKSSVLYQSTSSRSIRTTESSTDQEKTKNSLK